MSRACGEKIGPRIHTCRFAAASVRCSVSNRPDQLNASCPFTPPSKTLSTSSAISHPAARSASSERKPSGRGEPRPRPESELGVQMFARPNTVRVTGPPEGFRYIPDVLTPPQEKSLVTEFEKLPLKPFEFHGYQGNRRIYTFGHKYIFAGQEPRDDASIPDYLLPLTELASRISGEPAEAFAQLMVTKYAPGAGIGWHLDRPSYEDIVAVSFLAPCTLRLRRKMGEGWERRSAHIEPRSAYLLHGAVRNVWKHSIAPMDVLRYSVTLRTFRPRRDVSGG